jgi:hypothetical protein
MRPYRWTEEMLDKTALKLQELSEAAGSEAVVSDSLRAVDEALKAIEPYFRPVVTSAQDLMHDAAVEPRVAAAIEVLYIRMSLYK